jgi:hypothetical protein
MWAEHDHAALTSRNWKMGFLAGGINVAFRVLDGAAGLGCQGMVCGYFKGLWVGRELVQCMW